MTRTHHVTLLTLTLLLALSPMLGCKTASKTIDAATETTANIVLPPSEEIKLGDQLAAELEQQVKLHPDPQVQAYIQELGRKIVAAAGNRVPEGMTFTFKVIDDPETVNAFAMPGGHVYFYSGLLLKASSTAEVIGVMGHEVAHVTERHVAERLVQAYGLQMVLDMALGKNPGQIKQIAAGALAQGYLLKYGREQESESDTVGFSYVVRSGYDPHGMVTFFQKLAADSASIPTFLSSHPDPAERANELQQLIAKTRNVPTETGKAQFEALYPQFRTTAAASASTP